MFRQLFRRFVATNCFTLSASLAYTTLLALTPTVALIGIVLGWLPGVLDMTGRQIDVWLLPQLLPAGSGRVISAKILEFSRQADKATLPGILAMFLTVLLLMENIRQAFDSIWRNSVPRPLRKRVPLYLLSLFVWPVIIGLALTFLSYAVTLSQGLSIHLPGLDRFLLRFAPLLTSTFVFSLLYRFVPSVYVRSRHALCAGLFAALCFFLMQYAFELYLAYFPFHANVYGALSLIPVFLVWLYCGWVIILCGAFLAAMLAEL
jgi:membrane protein